MKKTIYKKILSFIMILTVVSPIVLPLGVALYPQKAEAVVPVGVIANAWQEVKDALLKALQSALRVAVRTLIQQMVQEIVAWINNGFQGNPAFITNPEGFFKNTADQAIGEFIFKDSSLNFLCSPFQIKVKLALGLDYRPFYKQINCTLSGVLRNIKNSFNSFANGSFIDNGGWDTWFSLATNPQNTPQGSYLMAQEQLGIKIQGNKDINLLDTNWSGGALSLKKCTVTTYEVSGMETGNLQKRQVSQTTYTGHPAYAQSASSTGNTDTDSNGNLVTQTQETECKTTTPGTVIADQLKMTQSSWIRQLELQSVIGDAFDQIISAFVNLAFTKLKQGLFSTNTPSYQSQLDSYMSQLQSQQAQSSGQIQQAQANVNAVQNGTYTSNGSNQIGTSQNSTDLQTLIQSKLDQENAYYNEVDRISLMLNNAETEFSRFIGSGIAQSCNTNYYVSRQGNINDIIYNIDPARNTTNTAITPVQNILGTPILIPTNKVLVGRALASSTVLIRSLNDLSSQVNTLSSTVAQQDITVINNYQFDSTSSISGLRTDLNNWLSGVASTYSTSTCPIATSTWQ